jgi:hypothetical protein
MKCEQVQELFPELMEKKDNYPDAREHLDTCSNCKTLFHIFKGFPSDTPVRIDPDKREINFMAIQKKMKRHDKVVFTRRFTSIAALFLLAIVSIFNINRPSSVSLADISDDVLYLQSETTLVPDVGMNKDEIIEYLVEYENIESLGNLF